MLGPQPHDLADRAHDCLCKRALPGTHTFGRVDTRGSSPKQSRPVRHGAHDGELLTAPGLERGDADTSDDRYDQRTPRAKLWRQSRKHGRTILRLDRDDQDRGISNGRRVIRIGADAEIPLQGAAHRIARIAHTDVLGPHATPNESPDERPAHVAAADDCDPR